MSAIKFETKPYKIHDWTILEFPKEASAKLPSRGQTMVKGTLNGIEFQAALEPDGRGSHWLNLDESIQKSIKARAGEAVKVVVESTKEWPEPEIPKDIQAGLDSDPEAHAKWDSVTPAARWDWIRWIGATNNAETRQKRIGVACSKLKAGEKRPCCFNRIVCCVPEVSKNGALLEPSQVK
jgi:hypothetical protein